MSHSPSVLPPPPHAHSPPLAFELSGKVMNETRASVFSLDKSILWLNVRVLRGGVCVCVCYLR